MSLGSEPSAPSPSSIVNDSAPFFLPVLLVSSSSSCLYPYPPSPSSSSLLQILVSSSPRRPPPPRLLWLERRRRLRRRPFCPPSHPLQRDAELCAVPSLMLGCSWKTTWTWGGSSAR
eukprot:745864-Hanusia_phi.AAC.2